MKPAGESESGFPRWLLAAIVVLCAALWWVAHRNSAPLAADARGVDTVCNVLQVPADLAGTVQTNQAAPAFRFGNGTITPLAGFSVAARVLSREDYRFGREADYSPLDLALGWGPMSMPGLAEKLHVSQGGRFYRYSWGGEGPPMPPGDIALNSANMHMVPGNAQAAEALSQLRAGDPVRVDGWLIAIDADDGWHWRSSMTRTDTGAGACEIVLVCHVQR